MGIYDRYVYRFFGRALFVCFVAFVVAYIVTDCLSHLDDFLAFAERTGSFSQVITSYYGARVFWFFDHFSQMLSVIAGSYVIATMQKSNELVAIMSSGISRGRIVRPLMVAVFFVSLLAVMNRELMIPMFRDALSRTSHDWLGDSARPVQSKYDNETVILFRGSATFANEQRIAQPILHLPTTLSDFGPKLKADDAYYRPADGQHPAGYLLVNVRAPAGIDKIPSAYVDKRPVVLTPADTSWLKPGQCFVVSRIEFEQLSSGSTWWMYSTSQQLIANLQNRSLDYGADVRVAIHARIVQPILDMLLFVIGLAVVFTRGGRNVYLAGALCIGVVIAFYGLVICCHALGANYLLNPAFAAWCPVLILSPVAYLVAGPIWE